MSKTENRQQPSSSQRDKVEPKEYANASSQLLGETHHQYGNTSLMDQVVNYHNLMDACKAVKQNGGAPGVDGMTVHEVAQHIHDYYQPLKQKLLDGTYKPQPVSRVEIPKPNGGIRQLGIPVVRDRVVQQAIRQVIEPIIDPHFSEYSYGFRPRRSTKMALKQGAKYYEEGYRFVVDCDLKQYFDTINHDKLMHLLKGYIQDKVILRIINRFLTAGVIRLDGSFEVSQKGSPQGGVISPLLSNIYLHELDKELEKRGHRFVRYADDFVIFVKSRRAGERVLASVTRFLEKELKLTVNTEKSKVGSPTRLKFLSCLINKVNGVCRYRPTKGAKRKFRNTLKRLTSRKRVGTFEKIIQELNWVLRGWINYFGTGFIKGFIQQTTEWLHHRLRQLILKRWKRPRTIITKLMSYGLDIDSAKRIAFSRKKYWRLSCSKEMHQAITTKRLHQWGLVDTNTLAEKVYLTY